MRQGTCLPCSLASATSARQAHAPFSASQCRTCLNPALKRTCLVNRPSLGGAEPGAEPGNTTAAVVHSLLPMLHEPPVPPHGVKGFALPIDPSTRPRKWARRWCAAAPASACTLADVCAGSRSSSSPQTLPAGCCAGRTVRSPSPAHRPAACDTLLPRRRLSPDGRARLLARRCRRSLGRLAARRAPSALARHHHSRRLARARRRRPGWPAAAAASSHRGRDGGG